MEQTIINKLKKFKPIKNSNGGYVYILLANDNTIKIGITTNPLIRIRQIENASGKQIEDVYISKPCSNYSDIEIDIHNFFNKYRLKGEWFNCQFDKAVKKLKTYNFCNIKITSSLERCIKELKSINILKLYLEEFNYKKYNELAFEVDLYKWDENIKDIEYIKNMIQDNINYNIKYTGNDADFFNKYLNIYMNNIENNINVRESIQNYCIDYINDLEDYSFAKECLLEEKSYEIFVRILGIKEIYINKRVECIISKLIDDLCIEFKEEYDYIKQQLENKYRLCLN